MIKTSYIVSLEEMANAMEGAVQDCRQTYINNCIDEELSYRPYDASRQIVWPAITSNT